MTNDVDPAFAAAERAGTLPLGFLRAVEARLALALRNGGRYCYVTNVASEQWRWPRVARSGNGRIGSGNLRKTLDCVCEPRSPLASSTRRIPRSRAGRGSSR